MGEMGDKLREIAIEADESDCKTVGLIIAEGWESLSFRVKETSLESRYGLAASLLHHIEYFGEEDLTSAKNPMGEMVERIALKLISEDVGLLTKTAARRAAKAAIEAMRDPTEAVLAAGSMRDGYCDPQPMNIKWADMIDEALKGEN